MTNEIKEYITVIKKYIESNYLRNFRAATENFAYPFFVPGAAYSNQLWDWDSWLMQVAFNAFAKKVVEPYEKGSILNFLAAQDEEGRIPITINAEEGKTSIFDLKKGVEVNIHKPCLAQEAVLVSNKYNDFSWLSGSYEGLKKFIAWYQNNAYHKGSGLYFWIDDFAIGVDNDPCTFYRPKKSTASIFLNCLMYGELRAMQTIARKLGYIEDEAKYSEAAELLRQAIQTECWDERDGFFYSADVSLRPVDKGEWLHSGDFPAYHSLPMRIEVWTGFLPMYYGIATEEQAERMVKEHYLNEKTFFAPYGVRSLSKAEKMYHVASTGNPSCWTGPIWANANYLVYEGLKNYGYTAQAKGLAEKTVRLFGKDIKNCGEMHEYYHPETGEGVRNQGFQSWNLLVYNLCNDLEKM